EHRTMCIVGMGRRGRGESLMACMRRRAGQSCATSAAFRASLLAQLVLPLAEPVPERRVGTCHGSPGADELKCLVACPAVLVHLVSDDNPAAPADANAAMD